jgi:hypothetical protein
MDDGESDDLTGLKEASLEVMAVNTFLAYEE